MPRYTNLGIAAADAEHWAKIRHVDYYVIQLKDGFHVGTLEEMTPHRPAHFCYVAEAK